MYYLIGIGLVVFLTFIALAIRILLPWPIFSYCKNEEITTGVVRETKELRWGIFEVLVISPRRGAIRFHFRGWQHLPNKNDEIEIHFRWRYHRFTGRSFNWVSYWKSLAQEHLTPVGKVLAAENRRHLCLGLD